MSSKKFKQSGYPVPRKELHEIRIRAFETIDWAKRRFGRFNSVTPVIEIIEYMGCEGDIDYSVLPDEQLPGYAARYNPDKRLFEFSETVWDQASEGCGSSRFIVAHELGHCALGHQSAAFGLQFQNDIVVREEDSEYQANVFADEYLMDYREMQHFCDVKSVMGRFGVDNITAERRIYNLSKEKFWGGIKNNF